MKTKMKLTVIAVLMAVSCAFNLSAKNIKINESKLTSLSYINKICYVSSTYKNKDYTSYTLDDGKGFFFVKNKCGKETIIIKDGVLYGRLVYRIEDTTIACNLHDAKCSVKGVLGKLLNDKDIEEFTNDMKDTMINSARKYGLVK